MTRKPDPSFWRGRKVLLTGQTGFKGSWLAIWLSEMGAKVTGIALPPENRTLYDLANVGSHIDSRFVDIRDSIAVKEVIKQAEPDLVIHMAAQALVRRSIREPHLTWSTNVLGTLELLGAVHVECPNTPALVVTSDKVYKNDNSGRAFLETDALGGKDPYSASKAACELLVESQRDTFFGPSGQPLATVRGGNVIGGGDFSIDRLIPDIVQAVQSGNTLRLRHPEATRPWQHVLDCLSGYLVCAEYLTKKKMPLAVNIGPSPSQQEITVAEAADAIMDMLGGKGWELERVSGSIEAVTLGLDPSLAWRSLGWRSILQGHEALEWTAAWYLSWRNGASPRLLCLRQIERFMRAPEVTAH